jgi:hypothetical protein
MDTTKLVVGQKVWMQSGDQFKEATVEEITENYVRVFIAPSGPFTKWLPKDGQVTKREFRGGKWEKSESVPTEGVWRPVPLLADELADDKSPENQNGYSIDFRYDGSQCGSWWAGGVSDPRPVCGPNLVPWRLTDKHSAAGN